MKTLPELNSGLTDEGLSAEPMPELNSGAKDKVSAALMHGAHDKEKHIPTKMPVCDCGAFIGSPTIYFVYCTINLSVCVVPCRCVRTRTRYVPCAFGQRKVLSPA